MATQDDVQDQTKQYSEAFNEDVPPAAEQSEDDAFGLTPPGDEMPGGGEDTGSEGSASEGAAPAVALVIEGAGGEGAPDSGAAAPGGNVEAPAGAEGSADSAPLASAPEATDPGTVDVDKETQRLRSWEGRLRTWQEELDAKGKRGDGDDLSETPAEEAAESPAEQDAEAAAQSLEQDFGADFVASIRAVAKAEAMKVAGEGVAGVDGKVSSLISEINDDRLRSHFERIYDAHPDFDQVAESPAFTEYLSAHPEAKPIVESGTSRQVNQLLQDFKDSQKGSADVPADDDMGLDAEGVRSSGGLRLPEAPPINPEYKDAWDQF